MSQENYQPTEEEMQSAGENLTNTQKEASKRRERIIIEIEKIGINCGLNKDEINEAVTTSSCEGNYARFNLKGKNIHLFAIEENSGDVDWYVLDINGVRIDEEQRKQLTKKYGEFYNWIMSLLSEEGISINRVESEQNVFNNEKRRKRLETIKQEERKKREEIMRDLL